MTTQIRAELVLSGDVRVERDGSHLHLTFFDECQTGYFRVKMTQSQLNKMDSILSSQKIETQMALAEITTDDIDQIEEDDGS